MDIYQLLPLLKGWDREIYTTHNQTIAANKEKELASTTESGWIVAGFVHFKGNEFSEFALHFYDRAGRKHTLLTSPYMLRTHGFIGVGLLNGARLVKADDTNNTYTIMLNPPKPVPFYADTLRPLRFTFKPLLTQATVLTFAYEAILITDKELFTNSLKELLSPPKPELVLPVERLG